MTAAFTTLDFNSISGDYAEFGTYGAATFAQAYRRIEASHHERHLWAFDSFEGLPDSDDPRDGHKAWKAGSMAMSVEAFRSRLEELQVPAEAYTTVPGFYEDSLPPLGDTSPPLDIALAYIDCDLYSSTVSVLDFLEPRLKHGMILAFDDYFCFSADALSGERLAFEEFRKRHPEWNFDRFRNFDWAGLAFVVERADLLP